MNPCSHFGEMYRPVPCPCEANCQCKGVGAACAGPPPAPHSGGLWGILWSDGDVTVGPTLVEAQGMLEAEPLFKGVVIKLVPESAVGVKEEFEHELANALNLLFDIQWNGQDLGSTCCPSCSAPPQWSNNSRVARGHYAGCKLFEMVFR